MHPSRNDETTCSLAVTDSEVARLLALCADQIGAAVREAFCEIESLSSAVLDSAGHADALLAASKDCGQNAAVVSDQLELVSRAVQESARTASTRLQFADRLEQRLLNVSRNLTSLARLMRSIDLPVTQTRWTAFLAATRATFTMEQERQMFDVVFDTSRPEARDDRGNCQGPTIFDAETGNGS